MKTQELVASMVANQGYIGLVNAWKLGLVRPTGRFTFRKRLVFNCWKWAGFRAAVERLQAEQTEDYRKTVDEGSREYRHDADEWKAALEETRIARTQKVIQHYIKCDDGVVRAFAANNRGDAERMARRDGYLAYQQW